MENNLNNNAPHSNGPLIPDPEINPSIDNSTRNSHAVRTLGPLFATRPLTSEQILECDRQVQLPRFWYPPGTEMSDALIPMDISENGEISLKEKQTVKESIEDNIIRIWEESEIPFEKLKRKEFKAKKKDNEKDSDKNDDKNQGSLEKFYAMQNLMKQKLWDASQEIQSARGLIDLLLANPLTNPEKTLEEIEQEWSTKDPPLSLRPDSIEYTYSFPEPLTLKRKIGTCKFQIASKRSQLKNASKLVKITKDRLLKVAKSEALFWKRLFGLKELGWIVTSPNQHRRYGPSPFLVDYGYKNDGSIYNQPTIAALVKNDEEEGGINVVTWSTHEVPKTIIIQLIEPNNHKSIADSEIDTNFIIPFLHPLEPLPKDWVFDPVLLKVHRTLQLAHASSLETDLFNHLVQEAHTLDGVLSSSENQIIIRINNKLAVNIQLVNLPKDYIEKVTKEEELPSDKPVKYHRDVKMIHKIKAMMLAQLRLVHKDNIAKRIERMTAHFPTFYEKPPPEPNSFEVKKVLRSSLELINYHFFLASVWKETQKILDSLELDPLTNISPIVPRLEAELIPISGYQVGPFTTAHLLSINCYGHILQFQISSPHTIKAMFGIKPLVIEKELDWFTPFLKDTIQGLKIKNNEIEETWLVEGDVVDT